MTATILYGRDCMWLTAPISSCWQPPKSKNRQPSRCGEVKGQDSLIQWKRKSLDSWLPSPGSTRDWADI